MRAKTKTLKSDKTNTDVSSPTLSSGQTTVSEHFIKLATIMHASNEMEIMPTSRDCLHKPREAYHIDRMNHSKAKVSMKERNL